MSSKSISSAWKTKNGEAVLSRERPTRGILDRARKAVQGQPARHRRDLSAASRGRFHRRSQRRRGLPAGQPGRHPPGPRRRPADGHPQPFQILKMDRARGNIVVSRRAVLEESRAEARNELVANLKEGQVLDRRGEEHHRLRRVRRSGRRRRPAARHRYRVAPHQSSVGSLAHRPDGQRAGRALQPETSASASA